VRSPLPVYLSVKTKGKRSGSGSFSLFREKKTDPGALREHARLPQRERRRQIAETVALASAWPKGEGEKGGKTPRCDRTRP